MTVKVKKKKMTISEPEPKIPLEKLADTVSPSIWPPLFGEAGKFENEAITFFHRIHCRECQRMEEQRRLEQGTDNTDTTAPSGSNGAGEQTAQHNDDTSPPSTSTTAIPPSPVTVEDLSLQDAMDLNKETLKRKLMLRRSVTELVDQGIYPSLKAPAAFAEQRKQLERAKTGDLLRHKLKMRPDRDSLVQHHILEDTTVDPSLHDRQKLLKKARLQDSLNDRLANRPGPLELVQGNILETDPELKDAIKEGKLQFLKTSELNEVARRHLKEEAEDGSASEGGLSPVQSDSFSDQAFSPMMIPTPPDITPLLRTLKHSGMLSPTQTGLTFSQISSSTFVTSPTSSSTSGSLFPQSEIKFGNAMSPPAMSSGSSTSSQTSNSSSSSRLARLKKQKSKTPQKARVIKFHEYKGPPSLIKSQPSPPPPPQPLPPVIQNGSDTPYNILLQQQQLLLQWQLESQGQPKNLPIFLSAAQKQILTSSSGVTSPDGSTMLQPQLQQVQLQQVASPQAQPAQTAQSSAKAGQSTPQKATATIISPVGTPIPVSRPSPAPTPTLVTGTTIMASIPAAPPVHTMSITCQTATITAPLGPIISTIAKAVTTTMSAGSLTGPKASHSSISNRDSSSKDSRSNNNNFRPKSANSSAINRPPVTKLDDLKVAELKEECKKRNLPVSGPKPNLLEKLKPFADDIVASWKNAQNIHGQNVRPNSCASNMSNVSSFTNYNNENSLTSPSSVQSITNMNHLINIQPLTPLNDDAMSMTFGSPPMSPVSSVADTANFGSHNFGSQNNQPMSPDMDIMSPTSLLPSQLAVKNHLNSSQSIMPMTVDPHSRPPSVVPMDIDLNGSHTNLAALSKDQNMNPKSGTHNVTKWLTKNTKNATPSVTSPITVTVAQPQPALPPPQAPPLPPNAQIITIRQQAPVQALTQIPAGQLQIHSTQTGHIQLQPGQPGQIQIQAAHPGQLQLQGTKPGHIQIQGNPQISAQLRAQLLQQISAQVIRLPTSSAQVAGPQVAGSFSVTGQPMVSGTISLAHPRPILTQVTQIRPTASVAKTLTKVPQGRSQTLFQVAPSTSQNTTTLVQVAGPSTQLVTTVQTSQGQPAQVKVTVPQTAAQQTLLQPIGQPPVISNEELVKRQQKQIDELRKQLMQYQVRLADAQQKEQKHNEQLQMHLAQAQIQGPDQAKAQQQAQVQAQALAQAKAQVQALQHQAQVQVQAAVQLQAQSESKALIQPQAPVQTQAPQLTYKGHNTGTAGQVPGQSPSGQARAGILMAASPAPSLTAASPAQYVALSPAMNGSPASTVHSSPIPAPTPPAQVMAPSPAQMMAPSPSQRIAPSPAQMMAPSPGQLMAPSPVHSVFAASPNQSQNNTSQVVCAPQPLLNQSVTQSQNLAPVASPQQVQSGFQSPVPHTIAVQPQSSMSAIVAGSQTGTVTGDAKAPSTSATTLSEFLQSQGLQQSLALGQHKLILTTVQPSGQQVILSSQPNVFQGTPPKSTTVTSKAARAALLQMNGVTAAANNRSSSVPSSPSNHSKMVRSATNPFFAMHHGMLKEPPKYDEAIKNKQNVLLLNSGISQNMEASVPPLTTVTTATSVGPGPPFIKSEDMDDVFEILIRNGELPASAAQEPLLTAKAGAGSSKSTGSSRTAAGGDVAPYNISQPGSLGYPGTVPPAGLLSVAAINPSHMTSIIDSSKLKRMANYGHSSANSSKSLSPADTVLSIANGLKYSTPYMYSSGSAVKTSSEAPVTSTLVNSSHLQVVNSCPRTVSSVMSPLSNSGSPVGSDSGVGSSVGRRDLLHPLSISPAVSPHTNTGLLPQSFPDNLAVDFPPFMDWSDSDLPDNLLDTGDTDMCMDTDVDNKDFIKNLNIVKPDTSFHGDDLFTAVPSMSMPPQCSGTINPSMSNTGYINSCPSPSSSSSSNINGLHSEPNLRELGFNDMDMMDPTAGMNIDVSDWLDVVMPPSGLTPTTVNPPASSSFCADPILTPKSQEFLDLFNLVEADLYTPTDHMGPSFDKTMEASTSKS